MPDDRPSWDEWALALADTVASRADCRRRRVGAVILGTDNRVVATGYNGTTPGQPGCLDGACPRGLESLVAVPAYSEYSDCIAEHAEVNAMKYAEEWELHGATLYITDKPCSDCEEVIRGTWIERAVWPGGSFLNA